MIGFKFNIVISISLLMIKVLYQVVINHCIRNVESALLA